MSENQPTPEREPSAVPEDQPKNPPEREFTPAERAIVFRSQLILFIVMGVFIIAPFIVWWLLSAR